MVASVLTLVVHEALGHGVASVLLGGHPVQLTSVNQSWSGDVGPVATRLITLAGIASNILWGLIALAILRTVSIRAATLRYFLWFFAHATLFMGTGYLFSSSLFGFGDMGSALRGLPGELAWRIGLGVVGFLLYRFVMRLASVALDGWAGNVARTQRIRELSLIPYLACGITITLSGILNPGGVVSGMIWSASAILGAGAGFALVPEPIARASTAPDPIIIVRSPGWITGGSVALAVLLLALAPGIPR